MVNGFASAGHKTALDLALDAYREVEAERAAERPAAQGDLFALSADSPPGLPGAGDSDDESPAAPGLSHCAGTAVERRGPGRPPGARNRRTDELARWFIANNDGRDPLERGIEIAGLPILATGVLEGLADRLCCSRHDAAKFWAGVLATTLPFIHQKLSQLDVRPAGAPGSGVPVEWRFTDDGELVAGQFGAEAPPLYNTVQNHPPDAHGAGRTARAGDAHLIDVTPVGNADDG